MHCNKLSSEQQKGMEQMICYHLDLLKAAFLISKYEKKWGPGNTGWFGMFCKGLREDKKKKVIAHF